ncbi:hypothetical protein V1J52_16145 [Streptomyces sp. TRM 70351]|uniref:hypothetical protein n=1 Tax=Streptomyces sp. TRM 70351 TaxID=3116552 RepID=UPI002E7B2477|nr:hypothetical protein [Streptomyces sp. TRM 70351]MEE1929698.1 hypothetical protein [Streptomyces sp. TRM 70351]
MNQAVRRIGRSLALVLPVVLVLSGTLAVASVPWAGPPTDSQVLTASAERASSPATAERAPHELLRDRLVAQLREKDPGEALTSLQRAVEQRPSLARHCVDIARALGRAAVQKYGAAHRAQRFSRPVCDTSFAAGVADAR